MKKYYITFKKVFYNSVLFAIGFIFITLSGCKKPKNDDNGGGNVQPMYGVKISEYKQIDQHIKKADTAKDEPQIIKKSELL